MIYRCEDCGYASKEVIDVGMHYVNEHIEEFIKLYVKDRIGEYIKVN